jgi:hypothetical protein
LVYDLFASPELENVDVFIAGASKLVSILAKLYNIIKDNRCVN